MATGKLMPLQELKALFRASCADEDLEKPIRRFAAQCTVLVAHLERIEAGASKGLHVLDQAVAELVQHVAQMQGQLNRPATEVPDRPAATPPIQGTPEEGPNEDEDAEAMAERVLAETAAEERELQNETQAQPQPAQSRPVTPLRAKVKPAVGGDS